SDRTLSGAVTLGWGIRPSLELAWKGQATQSTFASTTGTGSLDASSLGDQRLVLKYARTAGAWRWGAAGEVLAPSPTDGKSWFSGIGAQLELLGGYDLLLSPSAQLRLHGSFGY